MEDKKFFIGVKALFTDSRGRYLILRKVPHRPDHKWEPFWDIPGGKIRGDDSIPETLAREVKEETGVDELKIDSIFCLARANFDLGTEKTGLFLLVYKCSLPKNLELKLSKEHDQYVWAEPAEAKRLLSYMFPKSFTDLL